MPETAPSRSNRDDRIARIDVAMISIPLPRDFRGSVYHVTAKNCLITRVTTARDPIFHKMIQGRGTISGGVCTLGTAPGWGVSFDPDFVKHHSVEI